ncbi:hypothetical protein YB2330_001104 [Saitoella coloradoensis]
MASSIFYCGIARGTVILSEHSSPSTSSDPSSVAAQVFPKITPGSKLTYVHGSNLIHYISSPATPTLPSGVTYLCIATEDVGRRVPFALLADIKARFTAEFGEEEVGAAEVYGMASFNGTLRERILWAEDGAPGAGNVGGPGNSDRAKQVKAEIDQVKDVMVQNIERVLERGERIDLLVNKTDQLNNQAFQFRKRSTALRRRMWWKSTRMLGLLIGTIVFLMYLAVGAACGLPGWQQCRR